MTTDVGRVPDGTGLSQAEPCSTVSALTGFDPSRLADLARRCEAESEADRALDIEIVVALDWRDPDWEEGERTAKEMADRHGLPWLITRSVEGYNSTWRHLPRFTASLDAALSLVPEGWFWMAGRRDGNRCRAHVNNGESHFVGIAARPNPAKRWFECLADTPVLALCAAALTARAAIAGEARSGETVQQGSTGTASTRAEGIAQQDTAHD